VIAGLALNRGSVGLFALERPAGAQYFPSLIEFMTAFGVLAIAAVVYVLVTQYLSVNEKVTYEPS
jgi:Ni/Fe-hydrogenase subunit HybB-like protein